VTPVTRTRTRTVADLSPERLRGAKVLMRVDFNVPMHPDGTIADPVRIESALPTLRTLLEQGARVLLVSHFGRPEGPEDLRYSLEPVAQWLSDALGFHVPLLSDAVGSASLRLATEDLEGGRCALLENIRFDVGETKNDPDLSEALAGLADVFVTDAFGAAHRAHASTVGAAERVRAKGGEVVAGALMDRELRFLRDALEAPARPFVAIMGGAKISGKLDLIEAILPSVDQLLIGGAMANTFFRALGLETGDSLVEEDRVELAKGLLERAGSRIVLPVDCVVAPELTVDAEIREADRTDVRPGDRIGDVGPKTLALYQTYISGAGTVVWNGPMGVFELPPFSKGTFGVAVALAEAADSGTLAVLGGGDSAAAAEAAGVAMRMTHVSTGGGASLDLLAGKPLPGVDVLDRVELSEAESSP
jgi:phosphoglycerate kinase